jgi:phosphohistidine phosphatase
VQLALLRHGVAEDAGPRTGHRDEPRALTPDGEERMHRAAGGILALGVRPDLVLSSPLTRCHQTAEIVADLLGIDVVDDGRLAPGMSLRLLAEAVSEHPGTESVLVCGHQPDLSEVTADLIGGGRVEFRKGALALLEVRELAPVGAYLRAHYPPAALRQLGL